MDDWSFLGQFGLNNLLARAVCLFCTCYNDLPVIQIKPRLGNLLKAPSLKGLNNLCHARQLHFWRNISWHRPHNRPRWWWPRSRWRRRLERFPFWVGNSWDKEVEWSDCSPEWKNIGLTKKRRTWRSTLKQTVRGGSEQLQPFHTTYPQNPLVFVG